MLPSPMVLLSNGFPLGCPNKVEYHVHSVTIQLEKSAGECIQLSQGTGMKKHLRKQLCRAIVASVLPQHVIACYEGENLLVTAKEGGLLSDSVLMESIDGCPESMRGARAMVSIQEIRRTNIDDISYENLPTIIETIVSSHGVNRSGYLKISAGHYVLPSTSGDRGSHLLTHGYQISVKRIQNGQFAAFIDPNVLTSYPKRSVAEAAAILVKGWENISQLTRFEFSQDEIFRMNNYLRGARVVLCDGDKFLGRVYELICVEYMNTERFTIEGREGKVKLKDTTPFCKSSLPSWWPVAVAKTSKGYRKYFPLDRLEFLEFQGVETTNPCYNAGNVVLKPGPREKCLQDHLEQMGLFRQNQWLDVFGVRVSDRIHVPSYRMPAPQITFASRPADVKDDTRTWRSGSRLDRGRVADVFVLLLVASTDEQLCQAKRFGERFASVSRTSGLTLPDDSKVIMRVRKSYDEQWLEEMFQKTEAETQGHSKTAFIMYIDSSKIKSHGKLKTLELKHKIVTQHVTLELALKTLTKNQRVTLDNIIAKANKKLGGRNYTVNPDGSCFLEQNRWKKFMENTLIIAADVCRPNSLRATVGLCSNGNADPFHYSGFFAWQTERQEHIDDEIMREFVGRTFNDYIRIRGREPRHVMYLRDGVNESQHKFVYHEIDVIRSILRYPITSLLVLKRHNVRLVTKDIENPLPGTVVDSVVVHPVISEFYLQPHRPLQGTAKAPCYQELLNEGGYGREELVEICHLLSYNHQICNSPVSLPAPVYAAHEIAKRGNEILKQTGGENQVNGSRLKNYEVTA